MDLHRLQALPVGQKLAATANQLEKSLQSDGPSSSALHDYLSCEDQVCTDLTRSVQAVPVGLAIACLVVLKSEWLLLLDSNAVC